MLDEIKMSGNKKGGKEVVSKANVLNPGAGCDERGGSVQAIAFDGLCERKRVLTFWREFIFTGTAG